MATENVEVNNRIYYYMVSENWRIYKITKKEKLATHRKQQYETNLRTQLHKCMPNAGKIKEMEIITCGIIIMVVIIINIMMLLCVRIAGIFICVRLKARDGGKLHFLANCIVQWSAPTRGAPLCKLQHRLS